MASKVLELLWNIAHDKHLPNEIIDQALTSHLKILDYSCLQVSDQRVVASTDPFDCLGEREDEVILAG